MRWRRGSRMITSAQRRYLRLLANEAFSNLFNSGVDAHHLGDLTFTEASTAIDRLRSAKERGWDRTDRRPKGIAP